MGVSGDEGVVYEPGVTVVAGVVCGDAGLPPGPGAQGTGLSAVLAVCALARLPGPSGPVATERFANHLGQGELRAIVDRHGADSRLTVKGNGPETYAALAALPRSGLMEFPSPPRR